VISGLVFMLVLQNYRHLPAYFQRILQFFAVALALSFAVGLVRNQMAAVYALAEYIAPLSIMGWAVLARGNEKILDRWIRTVGWAAVAACVYGWYQYYTIPPWDAFWVKAVGFEGYLGNLRPTEMTVFSTMAERGPLAGFLAFAIIPMLVSARWRNSLGWFSVALIGSILLLTFVRSSLILVVMAAVLFPVLNRGRGSLKMIVLIGAAAMLVSFGLGQFSGGDRVGDRLETLGDIASDGSFQGRIAIARHGISEVISNPLGTGLGSTGLAGRVNTGEVEAGAVIGDNGYLSILITLGWIGGACFFYGFYLVWRQVQRYVAMGLHSVVLMMFRTLFVTGAVALIAGDWISGPGSVVFAIFCGFAVNPAQALKRLRERSRAGRQGSTRHVASAESGALSTT
jgi:putative inorganic carbon (HCO3(-)) transporter